MVKIEFGQNLLTQYLKKVAYWFQSVDHFKFLECSASSVIFGKSDLAETPWDWWPCSNLDKSYSVTNSKYSDFAGRNHWS